MLRLRHRTLVLFAAFSTIASLALVASGAEAQDQPKAFRVAPLAAGAAPTFGEPTIDGIQGTGDEQGMRVAPDGTIYATAINTLSSGTSWVWRSLDGGKTFKWVPGASPQFGKLFTCPGGGDSEMAVDSAGHLYLNELTLVNFSVSRSDDRGAHFLTNCEGVLTTPDDREWYATDGDPTNGGNLYLTYNVFSGGNPDCPGGIETNNQLVMARSPIDGAGPSAGLQFAPSQNVSGPCDEAIMGNVEVSPTTHQAFVVHDNDNLDAILMGRCDPVDFTTNPTGLDCVDLPVASFPGYRTGGNFPSMAIDSSGNLFAIWQMAPVDADGNAIGDTLLYWASSTDNGETWTAPVQIPTPGLHNNVFTWAQAGDNGRVDIAWYGTPAVDTGFGGCTGPDGTFGDWSIYVTQTLNGTKATPTFTPPILASEHHIHRGTMYTLIGHQCGDRSEGDFMQMRIGPQGEAQVVYGDTNNQDEPFLPRAMFVKQNGGASVFASKAAVLGDPAPRQSVTDPEGDATYEYAGMEDGTSEDNLDILSSSMTRIGDHYRVQMVVKDLTSLAPDHSNGDPDNDLEWLTQWFVPDQQVFDPDTGELTNPNGGENFFAYMESTDGGPPTFWDGRISVTFEGGGVVTTYPGENQITGSYTPTAPGTITIDVPVADVTIPSPVDDHLYSVTSSSMTYPEGPTDCPTLTFPCGNGLGGIPPNLIDAVAAYDFIPPIVGVTGHAHTDLNHDGIVDEGDMHVWLRVSDDTGDDTAPTGTLIGYRDGRSNPPGPAASAFECDNGIPVTVSGAARTATVDGTVTCRGFPAVTAFSLTITDGGNVKKPDSYTMTLFDTDGNAVYRYSNRTTPGLGDLRVTIQLT